jgi:hypothetical protein
MVLTKWPPSNGYFDKDYLYICVTFGEPLTANVRAQRFQAFMNQIEYEEKWESYLPDNEFEYIGMLFKTKSRDEFCNALSMVESSSKASALAFTEHWTVGAHWLQNDKIEYDSDGNPLYEPRTCVAGPEVATEVRVATLAKTKKKGGQGMKKVANPLYKPHTSGMTTTTTQTKKNGGVMVASVAKTNKKGGQGMKKVSNTLGVAVATTIKTKKEGGGMKTQAYLRDPSKKKKKYTKDQVKKYTESREERLAEGERNNALYQERLANDSNFAQAEEARKAAQREKKKKMAQAKKDGDSCARLFGMVFGEGKHQKFGEKWSLHKKLLKSEYMPIGNGKFFQMSLSKLVGKDDLYEYNDNSGEYVPIKGCDILNSGQPYFAEGERLPRYDNYDKWYRSLPRHNDLITDDERKVIHHIQPQVYQPFWPFVIIDWSSDWDDDSSDDASHQFDVEDSGSDKSSNSEESEEERCGDHGDDVKDHDDPSDEEGESESDEEVKDHDDPSDEEGESESDEEGESESDEEEPSDEEAEVFLGKKKSALKKKVIEESDSDSE